MPDLAWLDSGTAYFTERVSGADLAAPSGLPGWTRADVVAHVASNARAIGRLAHWARTGDETPMYSSKEARDAEIAAVAKEPEVAALAASTAAELRAALGSLSGLQWNARVRTAQGREVPASEIVWMRTREVWIHAVDLDAGGSFEDFPPGMADALLTDVTRWLSARGESPPVVLSAGDRSWAIGEPGDASEVRGTAAQLAAWVTGRAPAPTPDAPILGRWL